MAVLSSTPTRADFEASPWADVIAASPTPSVERYAAALLGRAVELEAAGEDGPARALQLLGAACRPVLRPDDDEGPFVPMFRTEGRRSTLPEDFSDEELDALASSLLDINDTDLGARIRDILWVRRRDYKAAREAVPLYVSSAERLEAAGHPAQVAPLFDRAASLAAEVGGGRKKPLYVSVMDAAAATLRARLQRPGHTWSLPLFDLLIARAYGDLGEWAQLAEAEADRLTQDGDEHGALTYLERAARAHQRNGDAAARQASVGSMAEANLRLAAQAPMKMSAAHFTRRAIEHLRQVPGTKDRQDALKAELRAVQQESVEEYGTISTNLDFGEAPDHAAKAVEGKQPLESLFILGLGIDPINVDGLRATTEKSARDNPLQFYIPVEMTDATGRVVGSSPGGSEDPEAAIAAMMIGNAKLYRAYTVGGHVEPARVQIAQDQASHIGDGVRELVQNNWFVPPGREHAFYRGLKAGLSGDFLLAGYLLIPQLEHAVRYLLERMGVVTSGLNPDRRQNEYALTVTLQSPYVERLNEALGVDVVYDLKTLLVEPLGPNLRNNAMHGLMDDGAFSSRDVVYFWWLVLWLCCQGYAGPLPDGFENSADDDLASE